ncbi:MAG TPA: septum formation protein Maf [Lentisphaeria bacterium]|nr:MAG: septum formation protein Maf [Lentisphaerae bacterium GWF2_50_93]HCE45463.1 septum formation protein Maf [Lentisphaeria bacterium]
MSKAPLILASESPRRKEILSRLGFKFTAVHPRFEEIHEYLPPSLIPVINACGKAGSVAEMHPSSIVIGADTIIEFEGGTLGKPGTISDAKNMLLRLSGKKHSVVTCVCMMKDDDRAKCVFCDSTDVVFRKLTDPAADEYLSRVHTLDKAGAYAIQEHGDMIIEEVDGSIDNVIGFPSEKFLKAASLWL